MPMKLRIRVVPSVCLVGLLLLPGFATAPVEAQEIFAGGYPQQTGEALFKGLCQGCHMPNAQGAVGAGAYPALANNVRLVAAIYPITVVLNGQRAMPDFGDDLTDAQIANVLNYVRTHFGNHFKDTITPANIAAARRPKAPGP
jgi:mono/diheme cytochrome c family protein